jgi:hypothetical protein
MVITAWEQGLKLESCSDPDLFAFLWFYEWHLFDAVRKGEHTHGAWNWSWSIEKNGSTAYMDAGWLKLQAEARPDGAELTLEIANNTDYDWPAIAAIIPCLNPGNPEEPSDRNSIFLDEDHHHTYFHGENGLELVKGGYPREIHFNHECFQEIMSWEKESKEGAFVFDNKWPTSGRDAYAGIMIRESKDGRYVMGIAWESFLSAQGHNPWQCMRLSIKVGPLAIGEKKSIRGRIYLFEGSKEDCLEAFEQGPP